MSGNDFTILDFVKAHHHFSDPDWDGEPIAPEGPESHDPINKPSDDRPATPADVETGTGPSTRSAKPMSSQQFIERLDGQLPEFVKEEAELRRLWSAPDTRSKLLQGLVE